MYTAFYGLREKPFALSPDPRFLYLAGSHREALAHLLYGIEQGEGFISVTGEVGTGKTTMCRTLLERLEGDVELAFLFNPSRTALELLQSICAEFGLPAEGLQRRALMAQLNNFLLEQKRDGRRVLLIVDEAQTLSDSTLEQVRLLSNLETSREKLIQILLLGQPELDRKLDGRGLRQLRQRISVRWKLEPLSAQETRAYVRHRLAIAAGEPKDLFNESALREIHRRTGGVPRIVNQLCDRSLLGGYASRAAQIGPGLVRAAAREIPDTRRARRASSGELRESRWFRPWMFVAGCLALVGASLLAGLYVGRTGLTDAMRSALTRPDASQAGSGDPAASAAYLADGSTGAAGVPVLPAVGANAPGAAGGEDLGSALAEGREPPTLARLVGFVPPDVREGLAPTPAQLADPRLGPMRATSTDARFEADSGAAAAPLANPLLRKPARAPEVTAVAEGLLPRLLRNRDPKLALAESQRAVLGRFGRRVPALAGTPLGESAMQSSIEHRGLAATPFEAGSIALLRRLDHPVLIPLLADAAAAAGGRSSAGSSPSAGASGGASPVVWLAIVGFSDGRAEVAGLLADRVATISLSELEDHWLARGLVVWERFEPVPPMLARGDEGSGVLWLQRSLAELRLLSAGPTGRFDEATRSALRDFQRNRGLTADGVAGPLTQIALYAEIDRYPVPRLSNAPAAASLGVRGSGATPSPSERTSGERG